MCDGIREKKKKKKKKKTTGGKAQILPDFPTASALDRMQFYSTQNTDSLKTKTLPVAVVRILLIIIAFITGHIDTAK